MSAGKIIIYPVIFLVLAILVGIFLPGTYHVERSIEIKVSPGNVYPLLVDLRKWPQWGNWFQRDPDVVLQYDGPDRAIGMRSKWHGKILGHGEIEIISLHFNRQVAYKSSFEDGLDATGELQLLQTDTGTRLTWVSQGDVGLNILARYKLLSLEGDIAKNIEVGLENIKTLTENSYLTPSGGWR